MNRGQLRTLVANFVDDPSQTRFTTDQYNDAINRAQEQFVGDTKSLFIDDAYSCVSGTAEYALPADFIIDSKVTLNGLKLDPKSREDLEFYSRSDDWRDDTGTPRYYVIDQQEGKKTITLYPIPLDADAGTDNLIMRYVAMPAEMTTDSGTPFNSSSLMSQFHMAVANFATYLLLNYVNWTPEIEAKKGTMIRLYQDKVTYAVDTFGDTKSEPIRMKGGRRWVF